MRPKLFFDYLKLSLTQTGFYLKLLKKPSKQLVKFYLMAMLLWGLSTAARINWQVLPTIQAQVSASLTELVNHYPQDLNIIWNGQTLTATPTAQLSVDFPQSWQMLPTKLPTRLAYFDTQTNEQPQTEQTHLFLINSNTLYVSDLQESWFSYQLSDIFLNQQFNLNLQTLPDVVNVVEDGLIVISQKLSWFIWLTSPIWLLLTTTWTAFINAILMFILLKINQIKLTFEQSFKLSIHLAIVAELINQVAAWLYPHQTLPILSLAYWLILLYVLWTRKLEFAQLSTEISKSTGGKGKSS